jgi:hypothetical protein
MAEQTGCRYSRQFVCFLVHHIHANQVVGLSSSVLLNSSNATQLVRAKPLKKKLVAEEAGIPCIPDRT